MLRNLVFNLARENARQATPSQLSWADTYLLFPGILYFFPEEAKHLSLFHTAPEKITASLFNNSITNWLTKSRQPRKRELFCGEIVVSGRIIFLQKYVFGNYVNCLFTLHPLTMLVFFPQVQWEKSWMVLFSVLSLSGLGYRLLHRWGGRNVRH